MFVIKLFAEFMLEKAQSFFKPHKYSNQINQMASEFVLGRKICMTNIFQKEIDYSFDPKYVRTKYKLNIWMICYMTSFGAHMIGFPSLGWLSTAAVLLNSILEV